MDAQRKAVYWLMRGKGQVPGDLDWLHKDEKELFGRFRFAKKQQDWLLGRWTAKQALIHYFKGSGIEMQLVDLAVLPSESGAPGAFHRGELLDVCLTLSHRDGKGLCAIGNGRYLIGCDLEKIEPRTAAFIHDYFTDDERTQIDECGELHRPLLANLVWSAKESALKALKTGLRMDTREVRIEIGPEEDRSKWSSFDISLKTRKEKLYGRWKAEAGLVRTVVCDQAGFLLEEMP